MRIYVLAVLLAFTLAFSADAAERLKPVQAPPVPTKSTPAQTRDVPTSTAQKSTPMQTSDVKGGMLNLQPTPIRDRIHDRIGSGERCTPIRTLLSMVRTVICR